MTQIRSQTRNYFDSQEYEQSEENNMDITTNEQKNTFWDTVHEYQVDTLLKSTARNVEMTEIIHELQKNTDTICLYRFASNYNGAPCKGHVISGICLYHWHNLGISFIYLSARVLDNFETGSNRVVTNRFTPFFTNTHGKGNIIISPIIRSIRYKHWNENKNKLASLISACYTLAFSQDEAIAMAKGLLTLIFGNTSEIITLRNLWLTKQQILTRALDPNNIYQFINQESVETTTTMLKIDQLSIFDTPLILTLNVSTIVLGDRTTNLANPANISMFQISGDKSIGVFSIVGPIIYAPISKNQYREINVNDPMLAQQHMITYANIAGATWTPRNTIFPMTLSTNQVYLLNISNSKQFTNEYWDTIGNVQPSFNSISSIAKSINETNQNEESNNEDEQSETNEVNGLITFDT